MRARSGARPTSGAGRRSLPGMLGIEPTPCGDLGNGGPAMTTSARAAAVADTVQRVRRIGRDQGVTRAPLERIKAEIIQLASRDDLFPAADFPVPAGKHGQVYRLAE